MKSWLIYLGAACFSCQALAHDSDYRYWGELESRFEQGVRIIEVEPTGLKQKHSAIYASFIELGAQWQENQPDTIALILEATSSLSGEHRTYNFRKIEIEFDGETLRLATAGPTQYIDYVHNATSQSTYTVSRAAVELPFDEFERLLQSQDSELRITLDDNRVETIDLSYPEDEHGIEFAITELRHFFSAVRTRLGH